ncbi:MAG: hypothetical protein LQ346_005479 [Caloplaca aetnensis]|nr:MAG: hypothetical protein LQ346_005479 [Caloplaca aetnensis]
MFGELVYSRSAVRSALTTTAENLVAFINQGAQDYSRLPSEEAVKAFRYDSNVILRQLQQALHTIDRLAAVYDEVKDDYYWYDADTAKAYEQGQLSTGHKLQLYGRSTVMRTFFGINVNQLYLAPLNEKERKRTEARRALVAWKRDTQRLDQIREVIWEVDRSLQRFANSLPSGVDNPRNSLHNPRAKTTTGQGWLREFHRQEKVENHRLKHAWNKLLESVSNEEEKVELEIQPKLCSRVKAPEWERPNEITTSAIYIIPFAFLAKTPTGQVPDSSVFDPSRPTHPMPSIRPLHCCLPHWGGRPSKQLEPPPREQE